MADSTNTGQPAPGSSEAGKIDAAAITRSVTEAVLKSVQGTLADLTKNQQVLADTFAASQKAAADAAAKAAPKDGAAGGSLTAEAVSKLVNDGVAAALKAQSDAAAATAAQQALREKVAAAKLGDGKKAGLLTAGDEAALNAQADALAAEFKALRPDFGGAAQNGGTTPLKGAGTGTQNLNLTPGTAAYAATIKLPA